MEKYVKTMVAVLLTVLGLSLAACSSDDDGDGDIDIRLLATTWESVDGEFVLVFGSNYTGYYYEADYPSDKDYFSWQDSGKKLRIKYTSDDETTVWQIEKLTQSKLVMRNEEGEKMTFITNAPVDLPDEDDKKDDDKGGKRDSKLVGEWWLGSALDKELTKYYFISNGKGYRAGIYNSEDWGVKYEPYTWNTKNGVLSIAFTNGGNMEREYEIDGKNITLVSSSGGKTTLRKMDDKVDESFDPSLPPFPNNYIKNKITGYYYQITKVTSGCEHAGAGDNMNERFLHFFGANGLLKPSGLRIYYHTPYYDGIDATWRSGSFLMTGSGAYKYGAMGWINGVSFTSYDGDVLKITKNSGSTVYDYNGHEIELHVLVLK